MSTQRLCGYWLPDENRPCRQPVVHGGRTHCGRHTPPAVSGFSGASAECQVQEIEPNSWRCLTHADDPSWATAQALGARPPCRLPLRQDDLNMWLLEIDKPLDETTARLIQLTLDADSLSRLYNSWACPASVLMDAIHTHPMALLYNPMCPPEALVILGKHPEPTIREQVIRHRSCPDDVRLALSQDPSLAAVSARCTRSVEVLRQLAQGPAAEQVARNPACPPDILRELATSASEHVLAGVAAHPTCPATIYEELVRHPHDYVRESAAYNPCATPRFLLQLSKDLSPSVRGAVAASLSAPIEALRSIALDEAVSVEGRNMALRQLAGRPVTDANIQFIREP